MADVAASARGAAHSLATSFRVLNLEQKVAAVASLLLIASTFGPFSFIEAAEIATALGVLALLHFRAQGREFHLPLGDGTAIAAAGIWVGLLIVVRLFDRPLGQNLLALVCAAILAIAGASERATRPADDLPRGREPRRAGAPADGDEPTPTASVEQRRAASRRRRRASRAPDSDPGPASTVVRRDPPPRRPGQPALDEPLAPPEFDPPAHEPPAAALTPAPPEDATTQRQLSLEDDLDLEPTTRPPADQDED
ncbi:MAG TPA: hypothetical protein VI111_08295 [Thermoleophilaceae bacterium]